VLALSLRLFAQQADLERVPNLVDTVGADSD
jgi:hypothetical protein